MPFGKKADEDDDFVEPISKKKIKTYDEQRRETRKLNQKIWGVRLRRPIMKVNIRWICFDIRNLTIFLDKENDARLLQASGDSFVINDDSEEDDKVVISKNNSGILTSINSRVQVIKWKRKTICGIGGGQARTVEE